MPRKSRDPVQVHAPVRAVVLARRFIGAEMLSYAIEDELPALLKEIDITVVRTVIQRYEGPGAPISAGRFEELAAEVAAARQEIGDDGLMLVVNDALRPGQLRALAEKLEIEVIDRAGVILRIFERHARTRVARLEVEIAGLRHALPRVREDDALGGREGGGGRGERGHSNVTLKKQALAERIVALQRELTAMRAAEEVQRERRRSLPRAALVGYTNAGKSSLMRALTGSEADIDDRPFVTLGTTVRALSPATAPRILLSDTVGFIRDLPHELVASFHATLAEARDADLVLVVADAADMWLRDHLQVTREALAAIGATGVPTRLILNKIDRVDPAARAALTAEFPDALQVCAHDPADALRLRAALIAAFDATLVDDAIVVPFTAGPLLGEIHEHARVLGERYTAEGVALRLRAAPAELERWRAAVSTPPIARPDELLAAAERLGLPLRAEAAEFETTGLDFLVVHAHDADGTPWIVRTPRRPAAAAASYVEARVLRLVRPRLPVAVPDWRVHAPDVIAYPRIAGTPAVTLTPAGAPQWNLVDPGAPSEGLLDDIAAVLAALRAVTPEAARRGGVPVTTIADVRSELARSMDATRDVLRPPTPVWDRWQRWLAADAMWPQDVALVHGDLHPGHLLLGPDGRLVGVLDWTEARVTDPAIDLALLFGCFGRAALDRLIARLAVHGAIGPGLAEHAVERWAAFSVLAAEWAVRNDCPTALEHAHAHLAAIAAETPA